MIQHCYTLALNQKYDGGTDTISCIIGKHSNVLICRLDLRDGGHTEGIAFTLTKTYYTLRFKLHFDECSIHHFINKMPELVNKLPTEHLWLP